MIDPNKMEAFVNGNKKGGGAPEDEGGGEEGGGGGEENPERFAKLVPLLQEYAADITDFADEIDQELLDDDEMEMSPEDATILNESIQNLDRKLQKELKNALSGGVSKDEIVALVDEVEAAGGDIEDPQKFAGWLWRVSETFEGPEDEGDGDADDEDPEVEEDGGGEED